MRVLIAETDLALLQRMSQALERAGHEVAAASDGMQAWRQLTGAAPPDLVVTRLHLGPGTPPGTALGLRARSCEPPIPVLYIPADAERAERADAGHGAVLAEPFSMAELAEAARRLLGR